MIQTLLTMVETLFTRIMQSGVVVTLVKIRFGRAKKLPMQINDLVKPIWDEVGKIDIADIKNTYCNIFVNRVMLTQNYHAFEGRVANRIIEIMEFEKAHWRKIDPLNWKFDSVVVAGLQNNPHGHVNILIVGDFVDSPKWEGKKVPLCANVGTNVFWGKGVNWAFAKEPTYYEFIA